MGLFDFVEKVAKQIGSDAAGGLNLLSAIASHPIQTGSALISTNPQRIINAVEKTNKEGAGTTIKNTLVNTALAASTLLVGGSVVTSAGGILPAVTGAVSKAGIVKTGIVGAIAVTGGSAILNSEKAATFADNPLQKVSDFGKDVGILIDEPSLEKGIAILKEHPGISLAAAASTLAGLGYGSVLVGNILSNYFNNKAVRDNTQAIEKADLTGGGIVSSTGAGGGSTIVNIFQQTPTTAGADNLVIDKKTSVKPSKPKKKVVKKKKVKKKSIKTKKTIKKKKKRKK